MTNKKCKLKIMVIDVLKPHQPDIIEFGNAIEKEKSVRTLNLSVYATDVKTESVKIAVAGDNLDYKNIRKIIEDFGAVVHSTDKAVIGDKELIRIPDIPEIS